jgi:hypothetical protein
MESNNMKNRVTAWCKKESSKEKMIETTRREKKNNNAKRRVEREEKEKGKSGARTEFKPHFILDLGFLFYFRSNDSTHNNFFSCNGLHQHPQFFFPL